MPDDLLYAPQPTARVGRNIQPHSAPCRAALAVLLCLRVLTTAAALLSLQGYVLAIAESSNVVHFRSPHGTLIEVDVFVDGQGPFAFILDTGATSSSVDEELAAALHLPSAESIRLATWGGATKMPRVLAENLTLGPITTGPIQLLCQPLAQLKTLSVRVHGVLGQDFLLRSNFLIDNRRKRIEFDLDGSVLHLLAGVRVKTAPVRAKAGGFETRLMSVPVRTQDSSEPLQLLLDTGAEMVVLQPRFSLGTQIVTRLKWMANDDGKLSPATSLETTLFIGTLRFDSNVWIGSQGLTHLSVDGLLSTSLFDRIYVSNTDWFVILDPRVLKHNGRLNRHDRDFSRAELTVPRENDGKPSE